MDKSEIYKTHMVKDSKELLYNWRLYVVRLGLGYKIMSFAVYLACSYIFTFSNIALCFL